MWLRDLGWGQAGGCGRWGGGGRTLYISYNIRILFLLSRQVITSLLS